MSESLDGIDMNVYVDDTVVGLGARGTCDMAVVCLPVVLPCEARLHGNGPPVGGDQACLGLS